MPNQSALTLTTPVKQGYHERIAKLLNDVKTGVDNGTYTKFKEVGTIHYFRMILLEGKLSNAMTNLVISSDYDGDEDTHLAALVDVCGDLIDQLYDCCEGYPDAVGRTKANKVQYLKKWSAPAAAFYVGAPGRSLQQIHQERTLRDEIWKYLDENSKTLEKKSAKEVHAIIKQEFLNRPGFEWAREQIKLPKLKWWNFAIVIGGAVIFFPLTLLVAVFVGIWLVVLHFFFEKKDNVPNYTPSQLDPKLIETLESYEDFHNQNQFTQIIPMKPGWFRRATIKGVLLYGKFRVNNEFVYGQLMGIPTIHFARWVMLDNNKQVLFFSNFDGSWQQYLGDFIDKSGWGLTAIFSSTQNFPASRYLFWGGAYDEEHFLAWSRYYQVPTQVWYCAYPHLSIKNINTNSFIRHELSRDLTEQEAQTFLNRF